jgi:hypothetical protein
MRARMIGKKPSLETRAKIAASLKAALAARSAGR